ncbi:unnamed protein product [Parascedosporium putredinis]|uniref:PUM-HD domain-containing protein n=1 Tax=Parascedosporium putredinis TaxID=1442378 RepID=A0A9P1GY83_9PEZI|nr:unnamed protein product [Parascedosporium putredinis]CAI7990510.1 unnamed protein product [Parascedosporium putredinis]
MIPRPSSAATIRTANEEVLKLKLQLAEAEAKIDVLQNRTGVSPLPMPSEQMHISKPLAGVAAPFLKDKLAVWSQAPAVTERFPSMQRERLTPGAPWVNPFCPLPEVAGSVPDPAANQYGLMDPYRGPERLTPDPEMTMRPPSNRRGGRYGGNRNFTANPFIGGYNNSDIGHHGPPLGQFGGAGALIPSPSPLGTRLFPTSFSNNQSPVPLSPHAVEFTSDRNWKNEGNCSDGTTYLPPTEPLNYRRLLDKNVSCNWQYIVDKIVCSNDQQASIFLQQKLKVGTSEQKYAIIDAIASQAYPLIVNRFGNFLIQRCFEHGTPDQVARIAEAIRGNTVKLSMDPFGCHVVQKAFDAVTEDYKTVMVHELLQQIPETVIHRYACHVWQKLFELRWVESPPQIMAYVNEALIGMWHEVALGETGSLVVQNIFENCREEDKRPCVEEVLANIDLVAHGQFGNWCIQHICEHGAPADRGRAVDHVIRYAMEYSLDQFASKVVEKCLKVGGNQFCQRYLDQITKRDDDRPRLPIIDISADQYGNYLIQWIINNSQDPQHVETVVAHIRKHMVSLRGSKFGSRVGMLCTNPASATRPGPGAGPGMGGGRHGSRFGNGPNYR